MTDLRQLPKAELHVHLQAAMRRSTLYELAAEAGVEVADPQVFNGFTEFQERILDAYRLTQAKPENLRRLVRELVADVAADGGVWVQPQFDPYPYTNLGPPDAVMELVLDEGQAAGAQYGVGFGLTISASWHDTPKAAEELARFAARYAGRGVHAFGMAGDEDAAPADQFTKAFAIAREAGLTVAPHAGELGGPANVRAVVEALGARRIAHGIRAVEDPDVLALLVDRGVSLDVCLTSNVLLAVVPSIDEHPLPQLLAAGVRCSLGADDPLMFGVGLYDEYELARRAFNLPDHTVAELARTSIATSDAPPDLITRALSGVDDWLSSSSNHQRG